MKRRFAARHSEVDAIREFIESTCAAMQRDDQQRVILLVEELFANSVSHGYGGDCDEPVWLTLDVRADACRVVYEDSAPPHDPFADSPPAHLDGGVDERPIGGLGILLLTELSSSHHYARRGNNNVIEFEVPLGGGSPPD